MSDWESASTDQRVGHGRGGAAEAREVAPQQTIVGRAGGEAVQVGREGATGPRGEAVDHPLLSPDRDDELTLAQVGEVLGDLDLRFPEDRLKVTHAEGAAVQEVKDALRRLVTVGSAREALPLLKA